MLMCGVAYTASGCRWHRFCCARRERPARPPPRLAYSVQPQQAAGASVLEDDAATAEVGPAQPPRPVGLGTRSHFVRCFPQYLQVQSRVAAGALAPRQPQGAKESEQEEEVAGHAAHPAPAVSGQGKDQHKGKSPEQPPKKSKSRPAAAVASGAGNRRPLSQVPSRIGPLLHADRSRAQQYSQRRREAALQVLMRQKAQGSAAAGPADAAAPLGHVVESILSSRWGAAFLPGDEEGQFEHDGRVLQPAPASVLEQLGASWQLPETDLDPLYRRLEEQQQQPVEMEAGDWAPSAVHAPGPSDPLQQQQQEEEEEEEQDAGSHRRRQVSQWVGDFGPEHTRTEWTTRQRVADLADAEDAALLRKADRAEEAARVQQAQQRGRREDREVPGLLFAETGELPGATRRAVVSGC